MPVNCIINFTGNTQTNDVNFSCFFLQFSGCRIGPHNNWRPHSTSSSNSWNPFKRSPIRSNKRLDSSSCQGNVQPSRFLKSPIFLAVIMLFLCSLICSLWLKKKAFASKLRTYFIFFESRRFHSVWKWIKSLIFEQKK